jgi:hypothetical protein
MQRSRRIDWLLLGTLPPLFLAMLVGGIQAYRVSGEHTLPFRLVGAQGADGYPLVLLLRTPHAEIQPGDQVLRVAEIDLRGLSLVEVYYRTRTLLAAGRPLTVECERSDTRFAAEIAPTPVLNWRWQFLSWGSSSSWGASFWYVPRTGT